jgi:hypothetical protein
MRKYIFRGLFVVLFLSASSMAMNNDKTSELERNCSELKEDFNNLTFPNTRSVIRGNNSSNIYGAVFEQLLLPGIIIGDAFNALKNLVFDIPVDSVKVLFSAVKEGINKLKSPHKEGSKAHVILDGYHKRFKQIKPFLKKHDLLSAKLDFSESSMLILILANTVFDSKDSAPDFLILGNDMKISLQDLEEFNKVSDNKAEEVFNTLVKAAMAVKNNNIIDREVFMTELALIMSKEKEALVPMKTIYDYLESASKLALNLIPLITK